MGLEITDKIYSSIIWPKCADEHLSVMTDGHLPLPHLRSEHLALQDTSGQLGLLCNEGFREVSKRSAELSGAWGWACLDVQLHPMQVCRCPKEIQLHLVCVDTSALWKRQRDGTALTSFVCKHLDPLYYSLFKVSLPSNSRIRLSFSRQSVTKNNSNLYILRL